MNAPTPTTRTPLGPLLREHALIAVAFAVLSVAATWPMITWFRTAVPGQFDSIAEVWLQWHTAQAVLGREPLLYTRLLFAPTGASLLAHSSGPLFGFLGLPFAAFGAIAAFNGALLVGSVLTGWSMYTLGRSLQLPRAASFVAGLILFLAPLRLAQVSEGHSQFMFLGMLPLVALAITRALDPQRNWRWAAAAGGALLATGLFSGDQLIYGGIMLAVLCAHALWGAWRTGARAPQLRRTLVLVIWAIACVTPFVALVTRDIAAGGLDVARSAKSAFHAPDIAQYILPGINSGSWLNRWTMPLLSDALRLAVMRSWTESSVYLTLTALALAILAVTRRANGSGRWLAMLAVAMILGLGPELQVLAIARFSVFEMPIMLPFAVLSSLPGFDVIRTPGRAMMVGYIALALLAGMGLATSFARWRRLRLILSLVCGVLIAIECWPVPMRGWRPPPIPSFYSELANDPERYAVFDLPIRPAQYFEYATSYIPYSARYQWFQITHGKGIHTGHLARYPAVHPVFSALVSETYNNTPFEPGISVNGMPAPRYANARAELALNGYRYVVFHKPDNQLGYSPGGWADAGAREFLRIVFGDEKPIRDDAQVAVFAVGTPPIAYVPTLLMRETQYASWENRGPQRLAVTPVGFLLASPSAGQAHMEITVDAALLPPGENRGQPGGIGLVTQDGVAQSALLREGVPITFEFPVVAGEQVITLTTTQIDPYIGSLVAGNLILPLRSISLTLRLAP